MSALAIPSIASSDSPASATLTPVGTYDTGLGGSGAEIISVRGRDRIAAITNVAGSIDVLDVSNPASIIRVRRIDVSAYGPPNSTSIHPSKDYLLVAAGVAGTTGVVSAWRISDGAFLGASAVGILPDSVKISPNGTWAVVANEAEGVALGNDGGDGSLSLIDLRGYNPRSGGTLPVTSIGLPSAEGTAGLSVGRTDDIGRLPVTNAPATLEPETVSFDSESNAAYVTLQENSGVVRLDLGTGTLTFFGTGQTSHLADITSNNAYQPVAQLTAFREPDGIALIGGDEYFVTADEGDTRNGAGANSPRGGRTVSVFDSETGEFVADTGSALDDAAAAASLYPDARSPRGGSEPEVLAATEFRDHTLVAVGLERANAVALLDLTVADSPVVLALAPTGQGPEGVEFLRIGPALWVLTANEVSGTVSAFSVTLHD